MLGSFPHPEMFAVSFWALRRFGERSGTDAVELGDGGGRDVAFRLTFLREEILLVMKKVFSKVNVRPRKD